MHAVAAGPGVCGGGVLCNHWGIIAWCVDCLSAAWGLGVMVAVIEGGSGGGVASPEPECAVLKYLPAG